MTNESAAMLRLVPVGDEGLDNDHYKPVPVEKIKKMIEDYENKHAGSPRGQSDPNKSGYAIGQTNPKQEEQGVQEVLSCWLCLDAVLRLFEFDEDLEKVLKTVVKKGKVSGIRIYKGMSNGKQNFVFTTTREETIGGSRGRQTKVQNDRFEEGSRVLYIDDKHFDEYGGSMCPPNCKP
jgi:hypothetical protein